MSRMGTLRRNKPVEIEVSPARQASASFDAEHASHAEVETVPTAAPAGHAFTMPIYPEQPAASFERATSGRPGELPFRSVLERCFNTDFGMVKAYVGGNEASDGLHAIGAKAAAQGDRVAFRDPQPTLGLVAHEAAHVVQQRSSAGGVQCKPLDVSQPGDTSEALADAAALAVLAGTAVPNVGVAPVAVHRAVETSGGVWDTPTYTPSPAGTGVTNDWVGCAIELHFKPNDLVESPAGGIGITQTVKSMKSSTPHGARDTFAPPADPGKPMVTLGPGSADPNRGIDRNIYPPDAAGPGGARAVPNTNPMYGVYNPPGGVATSLNAQTPSVGATRFGSHVRKPDGTFEPAIDAVLDDSPSRRLETDHQTFEQTFEATALVTSGPLANTYLGSVAWGYKSDENAASTVVPLAVVQQGNPSAAFNEAAEKWNNAALPDRASPGTTYDTVDLPIDNQRRPSEMSTSEILTALSTIDAAIAAAAPGTAQMRKQLEKRALENEVKTRKISIRVMVIETEDWLGSDETYCKVIGPRGTITSPVHDLNDFQSFVFEMPLGTVPGAGPLKIQVWDQDSPDADDLLVDMDVAAPFATAMNKSTMDDANYVVTVSFA